MPKQEILQYLEDLFRYAMVLSRNRAEAEDLVQETYLRALRAIATLRPDSNLKVWMFTILRNVWRNQLRKQRSAPRIVELDEHEGAADRTPGHSKDPHSIYVSNAECEYVRAAIQQLPMESREVIVLREYEDLSYQQIADLLECPIGTVMSRLGRARSKLRTLLADVLQLEATHSNEALGE
ncbi:MAG: sigma-70 family RNA polymerase sigma factor [Ignavibacteriota bacterium]